ncbi:MAG: hypothetical protein GF316_13060 [Candidatus Lokiarchaeota archaeon]|nr:hypothetical protein [Candidatus Lokiarchaeota archaeon]
MEFFLRCGFEREIPPYVLYIVVKVPIKAQYFPLVRVENLSYDREL